MTEQKAGTAAADDAKVTEKSEKAATVRMRREDPQYVDGKYADVPSDQVTAYQRDGWSTVVEPKGKKG